MRFVPFLAALALAPFAFTQDVPPPAPPAVGQPQTVQATSRINAGDTISITVFGQPNYSGDFLVLEDGTINGRGFGRIHVEGKTVFQVQELVTKEMRRILRDPQVTVIFRTQLSSPIYVIGSTRPAGLVAYVPGQTLRELVASVGLPSDPDLLQATLYRRSGDQRQIDLLKLLRGDASQWNGVIEPFDTLVIMPREYIRVTISSNAFAGTTGKNGELRMRAGIDVYSALAEAGGVTQLAGNLLEELQIAVRRGDQLFYFPAKQDPRAPVFPLQNGDIVIVQAPDQIRISVGGEVVQPGEVLIRTGSGINSVLSRARGVTAEGSRENVVVLRGLDAYNIDASGPTTGKPEPQFTLQSNDTVFVRRSAREVFALGEAKEPGRYLIPDGKTWTAADLLAAAKGLTAKGTHRRVRLIRPGPDGKFIVKMFNIDEFLKDGKAAANPTLQPGDILLFGEPKGISTANIGQIISGALVIDSLSKR